MSNLNQFHIITTGHVEEVGQIREAFRKKHALEKVIARLIKDYEDETGLSIDMIHYQRDITLPIRGSHYTSLNIIISPEE